MDIIKKNIISVLCGVVILLAIIALFWPIGGMVEDAQKEANDAKARYDKLNALLPGQKQRSLPVVTLDQTNETTPLEQFPGNKVIEAGDKATQEITLQATNMQKAAVTMNEHAQLVPKALPTPTDRQKFDFRLAYRRMVREVLPFEILRSTLPPNDKDFEEAENRLWTEQYAPKLVFKTETDPKTGLQVKTPLNEAKIKAAYAEESAGLPEKIRTERAKQFPMYVDEAAIFSSDAVTGEGQAPTAMQMWFAQNALWVQQDVCRSIARLNGNSTSTLTSPVKHLISLAVTPDETQYVVAAPPAAFTGNPDEAPPPADPNGPIERRYERSPTGRVSNPLYDVVQFSIEVNVDARAVPLFLQELSREKFFAAGTATQQAAPCTFITVNKVDLSGVNKPDALAAGFVYGEAPIVRLSLQCEAILMRSWTAPLMPPEVKKYLGVAPPAPAEGLPQASAQ